MAAPPAHILIVDGSRFDQRLLADLLTDRDYRTSVASTGYQGYELAQAARPDLILMDAELPELDGIACCRLLKANAAIRDIPVIFLSAAGRPTDRVAGLSAGAVDYLGKPFHDEELLARIGIHLDLARRIRAAGPAVDVPAADIPTADLAAPAALPATFPAAPSGAFDGTDADLVVVLAAQRVITDNLIDLPGLTDIARRVGTYRERLNQLFRSRLGMSVFEYVREARIGRAKALMRDTALELRDIAELVGFTTAGNFSTAFREHTGMTPSTYRESVRPRSAAPDSTGAP